MRFWVTIGYWIAAVLLLASVMVSFGYDFGEALFIATAMLPGIFCARQLLPGALRATERRILAVASVAAGVLVVEWLALLLAHRYVGLGFLPGSRSFPDIFYNPVFLLLLLTAILLPELLLARWSERRLPRMKSVSFISERRKVTLPVAELLCVESNDTEVALHTADGRVYPTRTPISQWERMLDDRFVRIHRAWIVNREAVEECSATEVTLRGRRIGISRKYRDAVAERLKTGRG